MSGSFHIPVSGIKEGHHKFEFEIDKAFFDQFEESEIKEGDLVAVISLEKCSTHLDLEIRITGKVMIYCDRCLEMFYHPLQSQNRLLVKFGSSIDDSDPDIITITRDEHALDMKQYLYEFIVLALPLKRIHPDNPEGESTCDPSMLGKLKEHLIDKETGDDPRWQELKRFMNDN